MKPNMSGNVRKTNSVGSNSEYFGPPEALDEHFEGTGCAPLSWTTGGSSLPCVAWPPSVAASRSASPAEPPSATASV